MGFTKQSATEDTVEASADILTMPLDELRKRASAAIDHLAQADALLPGLLELPVEVRRHSSHYRDGEAEALADLLDLAAERPTLFEVLADKDEGVDPTKFEPDLLRERLDRVLVLSPVLAAARRFANPVSDTCMHLGNLTRPVLLAMYEIVKPQAKRNATIASRVKAVLDFYSAIGRAGAATRKAKKGPPAGTAP